MGRRLRRTIPILPPLKAWSPLKNVKERGLHATSAMAIALPDAGFCGFVAQSQRQSDGRLPPKSSAL
jgi:hypothetical protein